MSLTGSSSSKSADFPASTTTSRFKPLLAPVVFLPKLRESGCFPILPNCTVVQTKDASSLEYEPAWVVSMTAIQRDTGYDDLLSEGIAYISDRCSFGCVIVRYKTEATARKCQFMAVRSAQSTHWGLVKGTFERGEDRFGFETTIREFEEETGLSWAKSVLFADFRTAVKTHHSKKKKKKPKKTESPTFLPCAKSAGHSSAVGLKKPVDDGTADGSHESERLKSECESLDASASYSVTSSSSALIAEHSSKGPLTVAMLKSAKLRRTASFPHLKRKRNIFFFCFLREEATTDEMDISVSMAHEISEVRWFDYEQLEDTLFKHPSIGYHACVDEQIRNHGVELSVPLAASDAVLFEWKYQRSVVCAPTHECACVRRTLECDDGSEIIDMRTAVEWTDEMRASKQWRIREALKTLLQDTAASHRLPISGGNFTRLSEALRAVGTLLEDVTADDLKDVCMDFSKWNADFLFSLRKVDDSGDLLLRCNFGHSDGFVKYAQKSGKLLSDKELYNDTFF